MRTFEWILWGATTGWTVWRFCRDQRRASDAIFGGLTVTAAIGHAAIEGVRVHMLPVYMLAALLMALSVAPMRLSRAPGRLARSITALLAVVWIAGGALLSSMFPVFSYETPRGPYGIGTSVYVLEHGPGGRDLVAQVWYPASREARARRARAGVTTHPDRLEAAFAAFTGLPAILFDNLRLVKTHAVVDVAIAPDRPRFPVVLFSHGPLGANRSQSLFQMEALASAGFVAVAIDHTGYASTTIFPDGRAVPPQTDAAWPVFADDRSRAMVRTWVSDVRFVLDRLEDLAAHDPHGLLTGRLDLSRVGYLGASFGGSVVVQALLDEPRIAAGVAEDGKPYFFDRALTDLRRPLLYMQSAAPYIASSDAQLARWGLTAAAFRSAEQDHYARQMQLFGRAGGPIYNVFIRGTNHVTFSDLGLILRMPSAQLIDIRRAHRIINDYTIAFFDRYLNGGSSALVDGETPSPYDEVTVSSRNVVADRGRTI